MIELRPVRLLLRGWRGEDRESFVALSADSAVMEHLPVVLSRAANDAFVDRITGSLSVGWGLWAVEIDAIGNMMITLQTASTGMVQ